MLRKVKENKRDCLTLTIIIFSTTLYSLYVSTRTMPFAEGWYSYYAKLINDGEVVYRDFDYLFTPIYMYFIAGFIKIFGYKIIWLRILGVIMFAMNAILYYLIAREIVDNCGYALTTSLAGIFFVQSVNVNVFYDYIKMMDIFACLSVLFLIKAIKNIDRRKDSSIIYAGVFTTFFILCKQNMGLLFWAFSCFALIGVCLGKRKAIYWRKFAKYNLVVLIIGLLFFSSLFFSGIFKQFWSNCIVGAAEAKGGMVKILFGWIYNGKASIKRYLMVGVILGLLVGSARIIRRTKISVKNKIIFPFAFFLLTGIIVCEQNKRVAEYFDSVSKVDPHFIFIFAGCLFTVFFIHTILSFCVPYIDSRFLNELILLGAGIAIAYGAGTSGGLTVSESGLLVLALFLNMYAIFDKVFHNIFSFFISFFALLLVISSCSSKLLNTYYWWYQDDSSVYDCNEKTNLTVLEGLALSQTRREVYESICDDIKKNTEKDDSIYCFPQIPIFYILTERNDPGVRAKVQWFDVTKNSTIDKDKKIIEQKFPRAILMYNVDERAYQEHENLFYSSATKNMREFLYNFMFNNGYVLYDNYTTENNVLSLYVRSDDSNIKKCSLMGEGSKENPYIIRNKQDFLTLQYEVENGRTFQNQFFLQKEDIDLNGEIIQPIGNVDYNKLFGGNYNGNGNNISNFIIAGDKTANNALFGYISGEIKNLGIKNGYVNGDCCAAIASHSYGENSRIVNCYTNVSVNANNRAGGIADNYYGTVCNCVCYGIVSGKEVAKGISYNYEENIVDNIYLQRDSVIEGVTRYTNYNDKTSYVSEEYLTSQNILFVLNNYVTQNPDLELIGWTFSEEDGYPVLIKK